MLNSCYVNMYNESLCKIKCKNWAAEIKNMLSSIGLMNLQENQFFEKPEIILTVAKQRIFDIYKQSLLADINASSKCTIYKYLFDHCTLQSYLTKRIPLQYKKLIYKLRLLSHCLTVETGKYSNIPLDRRLCPLCTSDIEDEYHFILKCPYYCHLREQFLKKFYYNKPSVFKLIKLLSINTKCKGLVQFR